MYGFTHAALQAMVHIPAGSCLESVFAATRAYWEERSSRAELRIFEDELVGMCAHLLRLPLISCSCFARDSPCDGGRPDLNGGQRFDPKKCRDGTPLARLCRLPLGAHRVKTAEQYRAWWRFLELREPAQEELLDRPSRRT
mmetsp:Transcript_29447/g.86033  ORF Transcript_29447/g.86033 Transcript_29447/m.86033 type:complete len:141 (+) Transcript_29447:314-736(+)